MTDPVNNLPEFQQLAAAAAIRKLFSNRHFNVCDLDAIAQVLGVKHLMQGADYDALHALHCVDWRDMGPRLTQLTRDKCLQLLGLQADIVDMETPAPAAETPPAKSWWPRLTSRRSA